MVNKTFLLAPYRQSSPGTPPTESEIAGWRQRSARKLGLPPYNRPLDLRGSQDCEQHRQATDVAATQIDAALLRAFRDSLV